MVVIIIPSLIMLGTTVCEKSPTLSLRPHPEGPTAEHRSLHRLTFFFNVSQKTRLTFFKQISVRVNDFSLNAKSRIQEEQMLIRFTLNCIARIHFPLTLWSSAKVKGHSKWCTLVVLMGGYNHTKFEETWYHSLWKSLNIKVWTNFSACQLSPPERKLAKQNWYTWHTVDVLYIHTKFHLYNMCGSWNNETAYLAHMLTLWPR